MRDSRSLLAAAVATALGMPIAAHATNGMDMEGYGPIATGMGGASMAYDNGTAAVMNNPATLGLMEEGNRLDVALGFLGPKVGVDGLAGSNMSWDSDADSFYMPAVGWAQHRDRLTFGAGVFAQGGMGTDYGANSMGTPGGAAGAGWVQNFSGQLASAGLNVNTGTVLQDVMSLDEFSEVSVGRLVAPLAYNVNDKLTVGGSIDYVWAGMDLQMALPGDALMDMMPSQYNPMATQTAGTVSGSLIDTFATQFMAPRDASGNPTGPGVLGVNYGYFDFKDGSPYTGAAKGSGFAGKLGFTYKAAPGLTVGGTYHSETALGDLESGGARMTMSTLSYDGAGNAGQFDVTMAGKIKVVDFQWPATYGLGLAYQPSDKWMVVADVKQIKWSDVMKDFKMSFSVQSVDNPNAAPLVGTELEATMFQNWDDQTVVQLGGAYRFTEKFTARAGMNRSKNPIPASNLHYLFPAIIEDHYTFGAGYQISKISSVDFSLTFAPKVEADLGETGSVVSHSQTNWQLMYSHRF